MPKSYDEIIAIAEAEEAFLLRQIKRHKKRLAAAISTLERRMINMVKTLETEKDGALKGLRANFAQTKKIHKDMLTLWEQTYGAAFESNVNELDIIATRAAKVFASLDKSLAKAAKFVGVEKAMIEQLKLNSWEQYKQFGDAARERMVEQMYTHVIGASDFSDLVNTVQGILTGHVSATGVPMEVYAKRWAFDASMDMNSSVTLAKADKYGFDTFIYAGTIMSETRDFCMKRAGRMYTKKQIDSWTHKWTGKRGTGASAFQYRGGYSCRHHWRPVRPEWIDEDDLDERTEKERREERQELKEGAAD
jgi:hypothetical protein